MRSQAGSSFSFPAASSILEPTLACWTKRKSLGKSGLSQIEEGVSRERCLEKEGVKVDA